MRTLNVLGIAKWTACFGMVLGACMVSPRAHPQGSVPRTVVGVYILAAPDPKERASEIRANLEWLLEQELAALAGFEVKPKPITTQLTKPLSSADPWFRENGIQFYLAGRISHPLAGERTFQWEVHDVRPRSPKAPISQPASGSTPINNIDSKQTMADLRAAASQVRDVFSKGAGPKKTKRVLVSCFHVLSLPNAKEDQEVLKFLEMTLPFQLAALLHDLLSSRGYEASGLSTTDIQTFCKTQGGASKGGLEDQKGKADCVIEGMIRMSSAEYVEISFATSWQRTPVVIAPFRERINEQRIPQGMAKFIVDNWGRIEGVR